MPVDVRLFAALRDAAGTARTTVAAGDLPGLLNELAERYGEPFATRLSVTSVLVDGEEVPADADVELSDVQEVVLLPPFAGGAVD